MIRNVSDIANAYESGKWHLQPFTKTMPTTFNLGSSWNDFTMSGTYPKASYYIGDDYVFSQYPDNDIYSIYHGGNVAPAVKILRSINIHGSGTNLTPSSYILCDYLGYYPGISWETTEQQDMINTTGITRYTDGVGVQAICVQLFGNNANSVYTIRYTNTNDVIHTSQIQRGNSGGTGILQHGQISSQYNSYIGLAQGDKGIKRIESITVTGIGAGIAILILIKPLATILFRDLATSAEFDFLTDKQTAPIIYDGAKLNFLQRAVGSPSALFVRGYCDFIWS